MTWESIRLGDAANLLIGCAFKSSAFLSAEDEGVKLLRGDNVQQGYIRWGDKTKRWALNEYDDFEKYQLKEGDVILAMDRPIVGDGLKFAWITPDDLPALLVQRVCCLRGKADIALTSFLRYVLAEPKFSAHIHKITTGANIPHISGKDIAAYEFMLPEQEEQAKIVAILTAYDDLIEANQRRIQLLEESARLLYLEWFVKLRFPGHETVPVTNGVPDGWQKKALGDYVTLNYGKGLKETDRIDGDIPVYGSSGIVGYHNKQLITGPVIIVGRKGNVGSVFYSHCPCFPIDTVYFISSEQTSYYLYLALQGFNFISSDAAVPGLNRSYAYSQQLLVPSLEVFTAFEEKVSPIFEQTNTLIDWNKRLREARDMLLPKLMSGALDVSRISVPKEVEA